jgi:predicted short-subunit dehydrogenase-like oxidoreductase (DUF2520 family)
MIKQFNSEIDLVVVAVSDQAIASVIHEIHLQLPDVLIVHTSGSTDLKVLSDIHPMQGYFIRCKLLVLNVKLIGLKLLCL